MSKSWLIRKVAMLLVLTSMLMLLFNACGGGDDTADKADDSASKPKLVIATAANNATDGNLKHKMDQARTTPVPATATAVPPTATPEPKGPTGTLKVAVQLVTPANFMPSKIPWPGNLNMVSWGVGEGLVRTEYVDPPAIGPLDDTGIAPSWVIAPDQSKITFKIREGVKFHKGLTEGAWSGAELTAEDVAFSFNQTQVDGSTWARVEMGDYMSEAVALDDRTLEWRIQQWNSEWYGWMYQNTGSVPMVNKAMHDSLGFEKANLNPVMTGPFSVDSWKANDEVKLSAVDPHWRHTPGVAKVNIIEMPETASRVAAMKTGEVHLAMLPPRFLKDVIEATGGRYQQVGNPSSMHIAFAGNYWIRKDHNTGEDIFPRPGLNADDEHPWIGHPDKPDNMERARRVRIAMSKAMDRELINKEVLDGFGSANYTWWGFDEKANPKHFRKEWIVPFDPDAAKKELADAGFPNGFKVPMLLPPDVACCVDVTIGEAIAQMWRNIGLEVEIESTAYQARRPTMVDRSLDVVWMWRSNAAVGQTDRAHQHGVIPSAGWNRGMELPYVLEGWQKVKEENDMEKRIQMNVALENQNAYPDGWHTIAPVVGASNLWAVSPDVLDWKPFTEGAHYAGTFEIINLKE